MDGKGGGTPPGRGLLGELRQVFSELVTPDLDDTPPPPPVTARPPVTGPAAAGGQVTDGGQVARVGPGRSTPEATHGRLLDVASRTGADAAPPAAPAAPAAPGVGTPDDHVRSGGHALAGPGHTHPRGGDAGGVLLGAWPAQAEASTQARPTPRGAHATPPVSRRRPRPSWDARRWTVAALLAALPIVAVVGVVALLPHDSSTPGPTSTSAGRSTTTPAPPGSARPASAAPASTPLGSASPAGALFGAAPVASADLSRLLDEAGVDLPAGTLAATWTWKDAGGRGLLLASVEPDSDQSPRAVAVHVVVVADIEGQPNVLAQVRDGGPQCSDGLAMTAALTPGSITVQDVNGDGKAEVTIGWTHRCGAQSNPTRVRMIVVSPAGTCLLRGTGFLGGAEGPLTPEPDPDGSAWPPGLLTATATLFARLYR